MSIYRDDHSTYNNLTPFEKCVIDGYVASDPDLLREMAKSAKNNAIQEVLDQSKNTNMPMSKIEENRNKKFLAADKTAQLTMRDILLAVGGIHNIIATLDHSSNPEQPILVKCAATIRLSR